MESRRGAHRRNLSASRRCKETRHGKTFRLGGLPGRTLYTTLSTVVDRISASLYEHFAEAGASVDGDVLDRRKPIGESSPAQLNNPLSPPEAMIPVQLFVERDYPSWHALYCPSQQRVLPDSPYNHEYLQEQFELVAQDGLLHLVPRVWKGAGGGYASDEIGDATLCGQRFTGEIVPFQRDRYDYGPGPHPEKPPERDLYAEWGSGKLCKTCLSHQRALEAIMQGERHLGANTTEEPPQTPPSGFWQRLFG